MKDVNYRATPTSRVYKLTFDGLCYNVWFTAMRAIDMVIGRVLAEMSPRHRDTLISLSSGVSNWSMPRGSLQSCLA